MNEPHGQEEQFSTQEILLLLVDLFNMDKYYLVKRIAEEPSFPQPSPFTWSSSFSAFSTTTSQIPSSIQRVFLVL